MLAGLLETEQDIIVENSDLLLIVPEDELERLGQAEELKKRGDTAFENKRVVAADLLYRKCVEYNPDFYDAQVWVNRSKLKFDIGEIELSYQLAEHACTKDPTKELAWWRAGEAARILKRYDVAKKAFETALGIHPTSHRNQRKVAEMDQAIKDNHMIVNHNEEVVEEEDGRDKHPGGLGIYNEEIENVRSHSNVLVDTLRFGDATHYPAVGETVRVHYTAFIPKPKEDGKRKKKGDPPELQVFDCSRRRQIPFEFVIGMGKVIRGWDEAVLQMSKGQVSRVTIPPEYAYGAKGLPPLVRPNTTLVFEIELIDWHQLSDGRGHR